MVDFNDKDFLIADAEAHRNHSRISEVMAIITLAAIWSYVLVSVFMSL